MKISFITTILNEEESIGKLLESLRDQSVLPDEVIIADGGSTDNTLSVISNFQFKIPNKNLKVKILKKIGNRSVGRNAAIESSTGDIIVCSDAGCVLDKDWIKNITKPFEDPQIDVVSGYYKGISKTIFQKCLIPYVLVMPDRVNINNFLPATRSMAFRKPVWEKIGGFDEKYSHNEDYVFAKKIRNKFKIKFVKEAIVFWYPPKDFKNAFIMFFRFAYGDAEARIFRPKVFLIFLRYIIGVLLFGLAIIKMSVPILSFLLLCLILYVIWSIVKNYKYINDIKAYVYLPLLQFLSDSAVILGTVFGFIKYGL